VTVFFGVRWDAPIVDDADQVPTPVGQMCYVCGQPIEAGDRGLIRACMRWEEHPPDADGYTTSPLPVAALPIHAECDMLGVLGHQFGVCRCTGWDTYGPAARASALELLARVNAARATDGHRVL
jgi:hypothetical protein